MSGEQAVNAPYDFFVDGLPVTGPLLFPELNASAGTPVGDTPQGNRAGLGGDETSPAAEKGQP